MDNPTGVLGLCCGWHLLFAGVIWWIARCGLRIPFTDVQLTISRNHEEEL